jgi:hypothetical protein
MTTWSIEITVSKGAAFPWKAAVVASNGQRQEVGEFLDEAEARSYAATELRQVAARENPEMRHPQAA